MKAILIALFLSVCLPAGLFAAPHPGAKIRGRWLGYTGYGMSYYRIKRNGKADCFYRNCTDRGTRLKGSYALSGDTVSLFFPNDTTVLFLLNDRLYPFSEAGHFSIRVRGLERTHRTTIRGAEQKVKHELRKRRRKYGRYLDDI